MRSLLFILLLWMTHPIRGWAQETPVIRHFPPLAYGGQNQNWALAQAPGNGWLYAGNNQGLLVCDGARWSVFSLPENQTVRAVAVGRNGELFCGGFATFGYWQMSDSGQMVFHALSAGLPEMEREEIWHILVLPDFVLFQSFSTIYKYDYQTVSVLRPPGSIMFAGNVNGRILFPVIERGLYELLPDNTFRFLDGTEVLANKIVQFLVPGSPDAVWAGTANDGIFEVRNGTCKPWPNPLNAVFRRNQLNKAIALRDGGWAIGTILNGVYVLGPAGDRRFHLNRENGLQNNTVLALCQDRDANLWLGLDRGIDLVALRSPITVFQDQTGLIGSVYAAVRWRDRLYIGANQGVFVRKNNTFELIKGTQGQVWELRALDDQLLCGHNAGTYRIDESGAVRISDVTGGWCFARVPGADGALIQGTYTGLAVFRRDAAGNWRFSHKIPGFQEPLKKIAFDTAGNLWCAHPNKGLFRLRLNNTLSEITELQAFRRENGLPTDYRLDLDRIGNDLILDAHAAPLKVVDSAGTFLFRPADTATHRHKWLPGLEGEIFSVDSSGVLLHAGPNTYPIQATLIPNFEHIALLDENTYLLCQESGYALLDRRSLPSGRLTADCVVRSIASGNGHVTLPVPGLTFAFRDNSLTFQFAAPVFEQQPYFSWKLDGFSDQWSAWSPETSKEFTNLPPGEYTFRVRNNIGGEEATVAFRIAAPWYRTYLAMAVFFLLGLFLLALIERIMQMRLNRHQAQLKQENNQELNRRRMEVEREKLAHEVDTKSRELNNATLNLIRKNEALQRLREGLLVAGDDPEALKKLAREIDRHLDGDHDWEVFSETFNQVHDDFFKRLLEGFPDLTPGDLRLAACLRMNLSSKEIAPLLNISIRGIENKRYRLRKKMGLPEDANLTEFMLRF